MDVSAALRVMGEVNRVVIGKKECIVKAMTAILAGGHILIEDIPGVGKTTMAMVFSRAMELTCRRVQFTPDVLPADLTGFSMYQKDTGAFVYQNGAVMCNLFLADEINRTSPKTQSALLEVMEEGRVTVDGVTRELPKPFIVMATQNPLGSAGTQPLPDSQLDRFMVRIRMGYPTPHDEMEILRRQSKGITLDQVAVVTSAEGLLRMRGEAEEVHVQDSIYDYIVRLVQETRRHPDVRQGVSPRGAIALMRMAKALAYLQQREYVLPEDIGDIAVDVLAHRIVLSPRARAGRVEAEQVIEQLLQSVESPDLRRKAK